MKSTQGKLSRRTILIVVVVLSLGLAGFFFGRGHKANLDEFKEVKVKRGDITISVLSTGTVQPENRLEIKPPIAGRMEKVLVKEGQKVRRGQQIAWMSSSERAALLDAARSRGSAEVRRWEDVYRPIPIMAPIDGTVILRNIEEGQSFNTNDPLIVLSDRLTVKAQVDETDIGKLKLHQDAEIVLDAYSKEKIDGEIDQIAFEAKTVNNVTTYIVDVLPEETPDYFRSGMTANVTFFVDEKKDTLYVPSEAIKSLDGKSTVLVKRENGTPQEREVTIGVSDGKHTEIVEGLSENDTVLSALISVKSKKDKGSNPFSPNGPKGGKKH